MSAPAPHLQRFLRSLHRRLAVQRGAERVGVCLLVASAAALLLEPILWWRGDSVLPVCLVALAGGSAAGILWGIARRPTRLAAAMEADRQLKWDDLLGTACLIDAAEENSQNSWDATILAIADAKCRQARASMVLFNRWGGRAWGGIGLTAMLTLALALIPSRTTRSDAADGRELFGLQSVQNRERPDQTFASADLPPVPRRPRGAQPEDVARVGADAPSEQGRDGQTNATDDRHPSDNGSDKSPSSAGDGQRGGAAQNPMVHPQYHEPAPITSPAQPAERAVSSQRNSAGGVTAGAADPPPGLADTHGATGAHTGMDAGGSRHATPPWRTDHWPADSADAMRDVRSGKVPARYHDLVRDYFERR